MEEKLKRKRIEKREGLVIDSCKNSQKLRKHLQVELIKEQNAKTDFLSEMGPI